MKKPGTYKNLSLKESLDVQPGIHLQCKYAICFSTPKYITLTQALSAELLLPLWKPYYSIKRSFLFVVTLW